MANKIFYNPEGYIEVKVEDDQTNMSFENILPTALDLLDELQKKGKPRLGLIDLSEEGAFTPESNKAAMQIMEALNYDKLAMFGANRVITEVANSIILAMGKADNTKIFKNRDEAVGWLMGSDNKTQQNPSAESPATEV